MSLRRNILANYTSQIYVTLINIIMVPTYVSYMGVETYGLVGFFSAFQTAFLLLDLGLSPTLSRQVARYRGGIIAKNKLRQLLHILEFLFMGIAVLGASLLLIAAQPIATDWLKAEQLPQEEVVHSVMLMVGIAAIRLLSGLYRGAMVGFERFTWLSVFNSLIASLRYVGVILVFTTIGTLPTDFFLYQLAIATVELLLLFVAVYRLLPSVEKPAAFSWEPLREVLQFSLTIAFAATVWIVQTQADKLILSSLLSLREYGYFTIAVLMASAVNIVSGPIGSVIMPRMAKLEAEGDHSGLMQLYSLATQIVTIIAGTASITLALFAEEILWVWTGNRDPTLNITSVSALYAIGNGIFAVSAFPYYLQYAKGKLRMHLVGNIGLVLLLIPTVILATKYYGAIGAGYAWLILNTIYFFTWVAAVHAKFEPTLNKQWYIRDVFTITLPLLFTALCVHMFIPATQNRWSQAGVIALAGFIIALSGVLASSQVWKYCKENVKSIKLLIR